MLFHMVRYELPFPTSFIYSARRSKEARKQGKRSKSSTHLTEVAYVRFNPSPTALGDITAGAKDLFHFAKVSKAYLTRGGIILNCSK